MLKTALTHYSNSFNTITNHFNRIKKTSGVCGFMQHVEEQHTARACLPMWAPGKLGSAMKIGALHSTEAAAAHSLKALVRNLEGYEHHWQTLCRQHLCFENTVVNPKEGTLCSANGRCVAPAWG